VRYTAKSKFSQNKSDEDIQSIIHGLNDREEDEAADFMQRTVQKSDIS